MPRFRFQVSFLGLCLLIPGGFRLWLWISRRAELSDLEAGETLSMFWTGLRLDAVIAGVLTLLTCLVLLVAPRRGLRGTLIIMRVWALTVFLGLAAAELAGLQFFAFYDFRPNYLVLDHAADAEVMSTILAAYPVLGVALGSLLLGVVVSWWQARLARLPASDRPGTWGDRLALLGMLLLTLFCIRGTVDHRALNPSAAAFSSHRLANEVAGSGVFNVLYQALQRMSGKHGELADCIDLLSDEEALAAAKQHLLPTGSFVEGAANPLVRRVGAPSQGNTAGTATGPSNVIVVVLESFTGRLIGHLGGELSLSPQLDALAASGLALTRCYATGERTIQGLEATLSSFPPQPGIAAIRRPEGQAGGFDTLGTVLGREGFATTFVYGGQGIFDQMKGFFLSNGYDDFIEEQDFDKPEFKGSWGVSDDDLYRRVIAEAGKHHAARRPFLVTALTVSLHSPWEYPEGTIEALPQDIAVPDGFEYEELNTFLYADAALGGLIRQARNEPWFDDTLFVFVGDHGVHLRGRQIVPAEEYRVPAVFYSPKHIAPERLSQVTSQLDLAPTLLGLLGGQRDSTFYGRDVRLLTEGTLSEGFALMVYRKQRYAVVSGSRMTLLDPQGADAGRRWDGERWTTSELSPEHAADARSAKGVLQTAGKWLESSRYRAVPGAER